MAVEDIAVARPKLIWRTGIATGVDWQVPEADSVWLGALVPRLAATRPACLSEKHNQMLHILTSEMFAIVLQWIDQAREGLQRSSGALDLRRIRGELLKHFFGHDGSM
jgi:hypothetical protein